MNRITVLALTLLLVSGAALAQSGAQTQTGSVSSASAQRQSSAAQSQAASQNQQLPVQASGSSATSASANGSAQSGTEGASLSSGTVISAKLIGPLDAKKNRPGDTVNAQITAPVQQNGQALLPKGTKLIGRVIEVEARTQSQAQSALGLVFDQAVLRNGQTVPVQLGIQALGVPQAALQASGADSGFAAGAGGPIAANAAGRTGGNSLIGGTTQLASSTVGATTAGVAGASNTATGTISSTAKSAPGSIGQVGGITSSGNLASNSRGVFGLQGLSLSSSAASATQGSMIVSATRNVHLDSGTQMLLSGAGQIN